MSQKDWMLTGQEKAECDAAGHSWHKVQEAKKRAYIANGGVILNPDALEDMYEALHQSNNILDLTLQLMNTPEGKRATQNMIDQNKKALAKADRR